MEEAVDATGEPSTAPVTKVDVPADVPVTDPVDAIDPLLVLVVTVPAPVFPVSVIIELLIEALLLVLVVTIVLLEVVLVSEVLVNDDKVVLVNVMIDEVVLVPLA